MPLYHRLADEDPVLADLIETYRRTRLRRRSDPFTALSRSIIGQQISVQAAANVWQRLCDSVGEFAPQSVVVRSPAQLRAVGLSRQKAVYLRELALHFHTGALDPTRWSRLDDEEVIAELTRVKGVGRWTAQMFLIFHLLRPDVLPVADIGLQRAVSLHYNRGRPVREARLRQLAERWAPWRTVATWHLWRSLDPIPVEY